MSAHAIDIQDGATRFVADPTLTVTGKPAIQVALSLDGHELGFQISKELHARLGELL